MKKEMMKGIFICWCLMGVIGQVQAQADVARDVMLVLDNSGSMKKNDPAFLANQVVTEFIGDLQGDVRAGVVIFDHGVRLAVPLINVDDENRSRLLQSLSQIDYRGKFTNSPDAIERALYELKLNGRPEAGKSIIFLTDGIVDTGDAQQDQDKSRWLRENLTSDAAENNIRIFAIAFTENADYQLIQTLSSKTGGAYFRALQPEDLQGVFNGINRLLEPKVIEPEVVEPPAIEEIAEPVEFDVAEVEELLVEEIPDVPVIEEPIVVEQPVIEEPEPQISLPPAVHIVEDPLPDEIPESESTSNLAVIIAVPGVGIILVLLVFFLRRRKPDVAVAAEPGKIPEYVPPAILLDTHSLTDSTEHPLGVKPSMLGRTAGSDGEHLNYIVVKQATIGRQHAVIEYKDFSYWLVDQDSVNGTFLNGNKIAGAHRLKHGDVIKLHKYEFEFNMPEMDDVGKTVMFNPDVDATQVAMADDLLAAANAVAPAGKPVSEEPESTSEEIALPDSEDEEGVFDISGISEVIEQAEPQSEPMEASGGSLADSWEESSLGFDVDEELSENGSEANDNELFDVTGISESLPEEPEAPEEIEPDEDHIEEVTDEQGHIEENLNVTADQVFDLTGSSEPVIQEDESQAVNTEVETQVRLDPAPVETVSEVVPEDPDAGTQSESDDFDDFDLDSFMDSEIFENLGSDNSSLESPLSDESQSEGPISREQTSGEKPFLRTFVGADAEIDELEELPEEENESVALDDFMSMDVTEAPDTESDDKKVMANEMETVIREDDQEWSDFDLDDDHK